ncbi:hypothetical protein LTR17_020954 [Elasticomyces elasticus]|nr:hypothetical protein LTR17_020954 [Elasticomyces elasticus]
MPFWRQKRDKEDQEEEREERHMEEESSEGDEDGHDGEGKAAAARDYMINTLGLQQLTIRDTGFNNTPAFMSSGRMLLRVSTSRPLFVRLLSPPMEVYQMVTAVGE